MGFLLAAFPQDLHLNMVYRPTGGMPERAALISTAVPPYAEAADPNSICRRSAFDLGYALRRAFMAEINGTSAPHLAPAPIRVDRGMVLTDIEHTNPSKAKYMAGLAKKHGLSGEMNYWTVNHLGDHGPVRAATIIIPKDGPLGNRGDRVVERLLSTLAQR